MNGEKGFRGDLEGDDELPEEKFSPGERGDIMKTGLKELVTHYMTDPAKKDATVKFIEWIPSTHLEEFLVRCMEYGMDRTSPTAKAKSTKRSKSLTGDQGTGTAPA